MRPILAAAAALPLCLACALALAQQYKWVDKDGRVRYGDVPPPGARATLLRPPPAPASSPSTKSYKDREAEFRKRREEAAKAQEKQELAAQEEAAKKENCARARQYLGTLQSGQRIGRVDAKGERYYLSDAQIAQETAKARRDVQDWCGG